jgi:hypothetical protein
MPTQVAKRWFLVVFLIVLALLLAFVVIPADNRANAKPKPDKPKPNKTTTTVAPTTTTLAQVVLEGTAPVTDQGVIIYGLEFDGLPIPGGQPPAVRLCPAPTTLDFGASTFTLDPGLRVEYYAEFGTVIVLADLDVTGTVSYRLVCA